MGNLLLEISPDVLGKLRKSSQLPVDNLIRCHPLFAEERSLHDGSLSFRLRINDFSVGTRLINADAILSEALNRLCISGSVSKRSDQI
jgi:hypothetical protein